MRVQSAARSSPFSRAIRRGGMRGGRAGCHQPGCRIRYVRATPLASIPYSPCQTAQFFSFPRRVVVRGFVSFRFASHLPPELRGRQSAGGGSLAFPVALARRDALPPGRREGASRRSRWRFSAARPALHLPAVPTGIRAATSPTARHPRPADRVRASHGRGSLRRLGTPLPRSALGAPPVTPLVSEDGTTTTTSSSRSQLHFALK
jgi:hypothetical protein